MFRNYFLIALRNLKKNALYSVINIAGLSAGLAAAILIILYVDHEISADKHLTHYDELYRVGVEIGIGGPPVKAGVSSYPVGPDMVANFPEVKEFVRMFSMDAMASEYLVEYNEHSLYEKGIMLVDSNFFDLFDYSSVYGEPESALRHNNMAVITKSTAEKIFGEGNPVGKTFRFNREHNIEVGAVIEDIPDNAHLKFRMLMFYNSLDNMLGNWMVRDSYDANNLFTYVRADPNLNTPEFMAKVDDFIRERVLDEDNDIGADYVFKLHFRPVKNLYFSKEEVYEPFNPETVPAKGNRTQVYIFITIAIFLVIIAAINYMNMAIARSARRSREVGVRKVLGADRQSLIRQFMSESLLYSFMAFIFALLLVEISLPFFNNLLIKNLSLNLFDDFGFTVRIVLLVLFTGLLSGSYPAFYLSGFRPADVLKQKINLSNSNLFVRKTLVGLQFTISVFMIIATLAVLQQLVYMRSKDNGFQADDIMMLNVSDIDSDRRVGLRREMQQLAGIEAAGLSHNIPGPFSSLQKWGFSVETEDGFSDRISSVYQVDGHFADLYGIEVVDGRFFDPEQQTDFVNAFVINEAAVRLFGWDDPIGKQIRHLGNQDADARRIIGVVRDFQIASIDHAIEPLIMFPIENGSMLSLRVSEGSIGSVLQAAEEVWNDFAGNLPMRHQFMQERQRLAYEGYTKLGQLFALFAALCIFLSLMGLFGLSGFSVEQKTKEIGIRIVHGASLKNILAMLYNEYVWLMAVAVVIASFAAWFFVDNWLAQFAYRIQLGVLPFLAASILSFGISLLTVGYHAFRSSRTNPVEALKNE
jgi:putative ABC transport system permease protein